MSTLTPALETGALAMRYRRGWALRDCTFTLPAGRISALIGPNGAGKSTLMRIATGLLRPTGGTIRVLGEEPTHRGAHPGLAFLGQDKPLYKGFTVAEMLRAGEELNPAWDREYAHRLVREAGVPAHARIGTLSGGQRTRVALALALGRRPRLVLLDEPLADLDPVARQEVMQTLLAEVADTELTVLLSSHVIADLDGVCDHLVLLTDGRVRLHGDVDDLLAGHRVLIGSRDLELPRGVVEFRATGRQATVLARTGDVAGWDNNEPSLEELALGYLRSSKGAAA